MQATDAMVERAELRVVAETDAGIARIRARMAARPGRLICECGSEISEARRLAAPHSDKCIDCATFLERQRRSA